MGWFKTIKGASPSLAQIDKTLSVGVGEEGIVRGTLLRIDSSYEQENGGVFRMAQAADATDPATMIYIALVGQDDYQAGMAGTIGQGVAGGVARITGLSAVMPQEFETDQFDGDLAVGTKLTCGDDGKLVAAVAGDCVVAIVTKANSTRWVNDAQVPGVNRTGAPVEVIQAATAWVGVPLS